MRYYLSKQDIEDGIVCNIITDITYDTRVTDNGFLIKYNFKEIISEDIVLIKEDGLIALHNVKYPEKVTILRQSFDSWVTMMTKLNRLFIRTDLLGAKILLQDGILNSIWPYFTYIAFRHSFGPNVELPIIPKYYKKLKLEGIPMKTSELKELLTRNEQSLQTGHRLVFKFGDLEVVIMPKKPDQDKDGKTEHDVYINNIHQRRLPHDHEWFKIYNPEWRQDWRELLSLNWPEQGTKDNLFPYFVKAISTGPDDTNFTLHDDKSIITKGRTLFEAEEMKLRAESHPGTPYALKIDSKAQIKEFGVNAVSNTEEGIKLLNIPLKPIKPINTKGVKFKPMTPETAEKIKRLDYLKTSNAEIKATAKKLKKENKHKQLVCVKDTQSKVFMRLPKEKASKLIEDSKGKYEYASKLDWKIYKKKQIKGEWNDGLVIKQGKKSKYSGINRQTRRVSLQPPKTDKGINLTSGHSTNLNKLTIVKKIIPAHLETVQVVTIKPVWEEVPWNIYAKTVDGEKISDVILHKGTFIRKKRAYFKTPSGEWKYSHVFERITEEQKIMIPTRYIYKTVYTMGKSKSRKSGNYSAEAVVGKITKPMKLKEKKVYPVKQKPTRIIHTAEFKLHEYNVNRENAKKNREKKVAYLLDKLKQQESIQST